MASIDLKDLTGTRLFAFFFIVTCLIIPGFHWVYLFFPVLFVELDIFRLSMLALGFTLPPGVLLVIPTTYIALNSLKQKTETTTSAEHTVPSQTTNQELSFLVTYSIITITLQYSLLLSKITLGGSFRTYLCIYSAIIIVLAVFGTYGIHRIQNRQHPAA